MTNFDRMSANHYELTQNKMFKPRSPRQVLFSFEKDIDFLIRVHRRTPRVAREARGTPSLRSLLALKKWIAREFAKIDRKNQEIEKIELKLKRKMLDKKDLIKDAKKIATTIVRERYPDLKKKLEMR